jgi:alkylation response protein AidB-like acyl-CoA dehydrogenase
MSDDRTVEDLDPFRRRAREFVHANLQPVGDASEGYWQVRSDEEELAEVDHDRRVQRMLFDAGLAGVCVAVEYGGQGLTPAHQRVLNEELVGYEYPTRFQVPTMTPCLAVILEFGDEEQKRRLVPPILRGEALWMQFLSEPSGGSDVAGALTTAVRDGDEWLLNGSKVWTTGAWWSDWGLCLARTNWDVPKHRGLSVFMFPIDSEGIEIQRIEMLNGSQEFCQEFLTDLRVPESNRLGEIDDGWTVGTRWMFHERMASNSPLVTMPAGAARSGVGGATVRRVAHGAGRLGEPAAEELIGEAQVLDLVAHALKRRVGQGIASRTLSDQSSAIARLYAGWAAGRRIDIELELAGSAAGAWLDEDEGLAFAGTSFLVRQTGSIGGGTTEMAANVISERVLGMPRERTLDRDVAFRDVPRSAPQG